MNDPRDDQFFIFFSALAAADSGEDVGAATSKAIIATEKAGQQALVNSALLPRDMRDINQEKLEALGFAFTDGGDRLFLDASLPAGWSKRPTNHNMWSELVDDAGIVRATIFYKAAFYDRSAFMSWTREE